MSSGQSRLLDELVTEGVITGDERQTCLIYAQRRAQPVEEALLELGHMEELQLLKRLANRAKTQFVSTAKLARAEIGVSALQRVPARLAKRLNVFPVVYQRDTQTLSVLMTDPSDLELLKQLQFATDARKVKPLVARHAAIKAAIARHYDKDAQAFTALLARVQLSEPMAPLGDVSMPPGASSGSSQPGMPMPPPEPSPPPPVQAASPSPLKPAAVPVPISSWRAARTAEPVSEAAVSLTDYQETLKVLVALLEDGRGELRGHSAQVARLCRQMCDRIGLSAADADAILIAAYLHDVGKPASHHLTPLNAAYDETYRSRAEKAVLTPVRIFESVRLPEAVRSILVRLYERWDGTGFPDRLSQKDIPVGARVLAIAESYADVISHVDPERGKPPSAEHAWNVLDALRGKVFDPNLLDIFRLIVLGDDASAKLLAERRTALIVDPDPEETTVLELRLLERGFGVAIARDALEAERRAGERTFDVIVSEVDLQPFDGFELLERLRSQQKASRAAFVFYAHRSEGEAVQRGFQLGAADYITKPASPGVVALKLQQVLEGGAARRRPSGGVMGSLTEMGLPEVVQVLFHGRKSGVLTIEADGMQGSVEFSEGQIFNASFGEREGEDAFYAMLRLEHGDFRLDPSQRPGERRIQVSPESLLLEGMRRLDEEGQ